MSNATIAVNRRARHDFEILQRFEAGIVLTGGEIKSVRDHKVQLQGSYARARDGEIWLMDVHISPYRNAGYTPQAAVRDRKLLLHKREIGRIEELLGEKGLALVPLSVYMKRGKAKVELGVARGLKRYDKRQKIREREEGRSVAQALRRPV
ncbi:MAG: SsrA-binding protein SmpB [Dehalococcoidia bacterium]